MKKMTLKKLFIISSFVFLASSCDSLKPEERTLDEAPTEEKIGSKYYFNEESHWRYLADGWTKYQEEVHDFKVTSEVDPTFERKGQRTYSCTVCGYKKEVILDKLTHSYDEEFSYDENYHWHSCIDKGYEDLRKDLVAHKFVMTKHEDATFESDGITSYACTGCDYAYDVISPRLVHKFSEEISSDETEHWHQCIDEGYEDLTIGNEEHDYTEVVTLEPTYEEEGEKLFTCKVCAYQRTEKIDKLVHKYDENYTHDEHHHWHQCIDEGYGNLYDYLSEHNFEIEIVEPTFEDYGYTIHTCKDCGYSYTDNEVDELVHSFSTDYDYDQFSHWSSCTDKGYEDLKSDHLLHSFETEVIKEPNYTEFGSTKYTCTVCGYSFIQKGKEYKQHLFDEENFIVTEEGHYHQCIDEGYEDLYSEIEEHEAGGWTIQDYPVDGEPQFMYRACRHCGYHMEETVVPANSVHSPSQFSTYWYQYGVSLYISYVYETNSIVIIPPKINGYKVVAIGGSCFSGKNISQVIIPEGVESISSYAFSGCSLSYISLPDSLKNIGEGAFNGCYNLEAISIPSNIDKIQNYAFSGCSKLGSVSLSENITYIGERAFYECESLEEIYLPEKLQSIGYQAFRFCSSIKSIILSDNVQSIGSYAFANCTNIETVHLPNGLSTINDGLFYYCESLKDIIFPSKLSYINYDAFYGCEALDYVALPDRSINVNYNAFGGQKNCETFTIIVSKQSYINWYSFDCYFDETECVVYFLGNKKEWNGFSKSWVVDHFSNYKVYYYSATYKSDPSYWRYVNGEITLWNNNNEE